jgi:hypothetical protein
MLLGKEAESEATVGGKPGRRISLQEYPRGLVPQGARGDTKVSLKSRNWKPPIFYVPTG